ncbi:MAG: TetR/AcrR family transcriptional regulator [Clostridiaceae bacterium]|jgi:AcrR family transcriptional regulator|nr:TetR/AcrR family transcriptional regulator [Clostridiaceae bacterium]
MEKKPARHSKEERKKQILETAKTIFIKKGYDAATTAGIAKEAGIAEITLFRYFSSKRELFESIFIPFLNNSMVDRVVFDHTKSTEEQVYELLYKKTEFISQHQGEIKLLLTEHERFSLRENYIEKIYNLVKDQLLDLNINVVDFFHMRVLVGMLLSFLYFPAQTETEKDIFIKYIVHLLLNPSETGVNA